MLACHLEKILQLILAQLTNCKLREMKRHLQFLKPKDKQYESNSNENNFFRRLIQHQDLIKVWITITLQRRYFSMLRFDFIDLKHGQRNLPCQATVILHCPVVEKVSRNAPEHLALHQRLEAGENIMQSCTVKGT